MIQSHGQQVVHDGVAQALITGVAVIAIVDAAQVDQLLESELRIIAQLAGH